MRSILEHFGCLVLTRMVNFSRFSFGTAFAESREMEQALPASVGPVRLKKLRVPALAQLEAVNKELWLLLSMFGICLLLNYAASQRMILSLYAFPTLLSAYA